MARTPRMPLERLAELPLEGLKVEWARYYGAPAPNMSADLLRMGIGYKLQAQRLGAVKRSTGSLLRQIAATPNEDRATKPMPRKLTVGTRLVRDWHGTGHTVIVLDEGFEYNGQRWRSLTAVAKAITGTHWNGNRFFGLTEPRK